MKTLWEKLIPKALHICDLLCGLKLTERTGYIYEKSKYRISDPLVIMQKNGFQQAPSLSPSPSLLSCVTT